MGTLPATLYSGELTKAIRRRRIDYQGGSEFDGDRWNDLHYTTATKHAARERAATGTHRV